MISESDDDGDGNGGGRHDGKALSHCRCSISGAKMESIAGCSSVVSGTRGQPWKCTMGISSGDVAELSKIFLQGQCTTYVLYSSANVLPRVNSTQKFSVP